MASSYFLRCVQVEFDYENEQQVEMCGAETGGEWITTDGFVHVDNNNGDVLPIDVKHPSLFTNVCS